MHNILYYISGHGYGHATRSIELIHALLAKNSELFFHIRTDAPEWIFKLNLRTNYQLYPVKLDIGAVQNTSFEINKMESFRQVAGLYARKEQLVKQEAELAKRVQTKLIVADIPSLAFDIAEAVQVPGIALTNFTWDWIYQDYVQEIPEFAALIAQIKSSYQKARLLLRLPFYGDLTIFPQIKDIPLIARKATKSREEVWRRLNMDPHCKSKLILVALRAADIQQVDFNKLAAEREFKFITLGLKKSPENCLNLPPDFMRFPELVQACDAVISKPGYGVVSEIIANQTPLLYTSRSDFVEYKVLVQGLTEYAVAEFLPRADFYAGNWVASLRALFNRPQNWKKIAAGGADCAAQEILSLLS
ncbi:MAG: glycosyltransferase family protein [bacterium]